jgi:hypothetical protein
MSPTQPEPAYYVLRTLCTVLENAEPADIPVELSNKSREFDTWAFALPENGLLVGVWLPGASVDRHPGVATDVIIPGTGASKVVGIDTLNGTERELRFEQRDGKLVIPDLLVRDYPLMLRLTSVAR